MIIYPAIDLKDGKCVRLVKGDFNQSTVYSNSPYEMLKNFSKAGVTSVHMVDLDGAKAGKVSQLDLIMDLVQSSNMNIQVGGGIRTRDEIAELFDCGVARVVLGSVCISNKSLVQSFINEFGNDRIVLALDCSYTNGIPLVKTHGWQDTSKESLWDVLDEYDNIGYVLCTDISVDGTLSGPNFALYREFQERFPQINLIASGGVGSMSDILALKELNIHGVVVGKAIYEGAVNLEDII